MKYESEYPIPAITTTAILATYNKVLLVKRKKDPFKDMWCFPGGFFNQFESATDCLAREVMEETGINIRADCYNTSPLMVISNKDRDPRGWVIDCPFFIRMPCIRPCKANDDALEAKWFDVDDVDFTPLAFDHDETWKHIRLHFSYWFLP